MRIKNVVLPEYFCARRARKYHEQKLRAEDVPRARCSTRTMFRAHDVSRAHDMKCPASPLTVIQLCTWKTLLLAEEANFVLIEGGFYLSNSSLSVKKYVCL